MADAYSESRGKRLRRERKRRHWTQKELAEIIGVTELTVQRWEKDQTKPQQELLDRLIETFGKPPEEWGNARQICWNVPRRNRYFTGREKLLERLHQTLTDERTVALTGLPGIGKTQAVTEYAHRYSKEYEAIFWIHADSERLLSDFTYLAVVLNFAPQVQQERDQQRIISMVKHWLENHDAWLLIFDNADDLALVSRCLPGRASGTVLLTTRSQTTGPDIDPIAMEEMNCEEGITFLLRRIYADKERKHSSTGIDPQEREEAGQIWECVGGLPLALDQAAAYIEEMRVSFSDYLDLFETSRNILLKRRGLAREHPEPVAVTWLMALDKIEQGCHPAAAELLRFCAFLHPGAMPEAMLRKGADALAPVFQSLATDKSEWNEAIAELHKYSLIKRIGRKKILTMHRLVQDVIKDSMNQKTVRDWAERAVQAVSATFPHPDPGSWPQCESLMPHALLAAGYIETYQILREEAGSLLYKMASYLQDRARYPDAEPLYSQALHIREQQLGLEHPQVAVVLNGMAELYRKQGKYELAEPLFLRALRIWGQQSGPEPAEVAGALTGLGRLYYEQGKYELAEPCYSQALSIREQQLGLEHPQVAIALKGLGELYRKQGRYAKAEPLFLRAIHIWEQQPGSEPPDMSEPLNNLAALYCEQGRYTEAEPLFQRALHIWEQRLGPEHPQVAIALNNLAWLYCQQGMYTEAEPFYQRGLQIWEQHLGLEHYQVAYPLNNLAELYLEQGRYAEAKPLFQRALSIFEQRLGPKHAQVAYPLNGLAKLHHAQGEYEQAEPLYQRALSIREQALGPHHPETAQTLHDYATFQELQGNQQEAFSLYQRTLTIREQALGAHHPKTKETQTSLKNLLDAMGRYEEAAQVEAVQAEP